MRGWTSVRRVDRPNLGLLLDLYHMYLEDANMDESIVKAKDWVRHFHFSDSDRWPAGVGHGTIDFPRLLVLLRAIGYSGYLSEGLVPTEDVDAAPARPRPICMASSWPQRPPRRVALKPHLGCKIALRHCSQVKVIWNLSIMTPPVSGEMAWRICFCVSQCRATWCSQPDRRRYLWLRRVVEPE